MKVFEETLDRIARSGEAVFAIDGADRIILWNKPCEALFGLPARRVLGKPCYEVMCGRDTNGNVIATQARTVLCRCGASTKKPFCDGTHSKIGFQGAIAAVESSDPKP